MNSTPSRHSTGHNKVAERTLVKTEQKNAEAAIIAAETQTIRPFQSRRIRPIPNWEGWKKSWDQAEQVQDMCGLLHSGFDQSLHPKNSNSRLRDEWKPLVLYLDVADGWNDYFPGLLAQDETKYYFPLEDESPGDANKNETELRRIVSEKAHEVLMQRYFKTVLLRERYCEDKDWLRKWEPVMTPEFLAQIVHFYRPEPRMSGEIRIRNLSRLNGNTKLSHHEEVAIAFLHRLFEFIWTWRGEEVHSYHKEVQKIEIAERNKPRREAFDKARPWAIEVLNYLNSLHILHQRIYSLDEACLAKLREIALRAEIKEDFYESETRPATTLREAVLAHSPAAEFLILRQIKVEEKARIDQIVKARKKGAEAQQEIAELTGAAK